MGFHIGMHGIAGDEAIEGNEDWLSGDGRAWPSEAHYRVEMSEKKLAGLRCHLEFIPKWKRRRSFIEGLIEGAEAERMMAVRWRRYVEGRCWEREEK